MSNYLEVMKLIMGMGLFLADNYGFTPEKQAEYSAKAEIVLEYAQQSPEELHKAMKDVYQKFEDLKKEKKEKILND